MDPLPADLDDWVRALCVELGLDQNLNPNVGMLLSVAGDAAHNIARPAAPLTTFLIGYAAALNGGSVEAIENAATTASRLAKAANAASAANATNAAKTTKAAQPTQAAQPVKP